MQLYLRHIGGTFVLCPSPDAAKNAAILEEDLVETRILAPVKQGSPLQTVAVVR